MLSTALGLALFALLAIAVLPVPRVRRLLLSGLARLSQAMALGAIGTCGTFFVQPQAAPEWLKTLARPFLEESLGRTLDTGSGLPWLALAALAVGIALPALVLLELAVNVTSFTLRIQSLRREIRQAARWVDSRLAACGAVDPVYPPLPNEAAAASAALRSANRAGQDTPSAPTPLVLDLLK